MNTKVFSILCYENKVLTIYQSTVKWIRVKYDCIIIIFKTKM